MGLKEEEDVEDKEDGEELPVTNGIEKLCNGTYKCLYTTQLNSMENKRKPLI
jgi:hypothetical protein